MKTLGLIAALSVLCVLCQPLGAAPKAKIIVVKHPRVVAFFPPVTDAELSRDPDTNEALSDFQYYAKSAREQLHAKGIDFKEVYASSFAVKSGVKTVTFHPGKIKVGYYFVAPSKSPRVEYGVMTDSDILQIAAEYFRLPTN